jgi:FXSXX-COOH protein
MWRGGAVDDSGIEPESDLVDLTGRSLEELPLLGDAPLAHSIRRILSESQDTSSTVVSGHESSI